MTVKELRKKLKKMDQRMSVFVRIDGAKLEYWSVKKAQGYAQPKACMIEIGRAGVQDSQGRIY